MTSLALAIIIACSPSDFSCKAALLRCVEKYKRQFKSDIFGPRFCAEQFIKRKGLLK